MNDLLFIALLLSLLFSFRAITSISIALIICAGIWSNRLHSEPLFSHRLKSAFITGSALLFAINILSLCWTADEKAGFSHLQISSGLLFTPLAVCCSNYIQETSRRRLLLIYTILLVIASLLCLGVATFHYFETGDYSRFFYHQLVSPLKHHAIYFSILVFISIITLGDDIAGKRQLFGKTTAAALAVFLSGMLILLSSKLVLVICFLFLIIHSFHFVKKKNGSRILLSIIPIILAIFAGVIFLTRNPVSDRFRDITNGDLTIISQEQFEAKDYFNGLQFRLLQWKFTAQILNAENSWLGGIGTGDAQAALDKKYREAHMFTGDPMTGSTGFIGYNSHNQFLQTLLQTGLAGLAVLIYLCFTMIRMAMRKESKGFRFLILLLIAWLFTESVFETQYGVAIFMLFPVLFYFDEPALRPQ